MCPYSGNNGYSLRHHIRSCHPRDTVESPDMKLVQCPSCHIYLIGSVLPKSHPNSKDCKNYTSRLNKLEKKEENKAAQDVGFKVGDIEMNNVSIFKYLGSPINKDNDDWMAVCYNLATARKKWGRLRTILIIETSSRKPMANFYKAVVQQVLLYGSETWTLSTAMLSKLNSFHHQCARHICKSYIKPDSKNPGQWICPSSLSILGRLNLRTIKDYIGIRRDNLFFKANQLSVVLPSCFKLEKASPLAWWKYS